MALTRRNRPILGVAACTALSWLGEYIYNVADLPGLTLLSPENSLTALLALLLFLTWLVLPFKRLCSALLLGWGLLQFIGGGILSVLPFDFWPYVSEQTLKHYFFHALYGLAQIPLILVMVQQFRRARRGGRNPDQCGRSHPDKSKR